MPNLHELLRVMIENGASDMHITVNAPPKMRVYGRVITLGEDSPLTAADTKQLCYSVLTESQKFKFEEENEIDFSFGVKGLSRFRANVYMQRGAVSGSFRVIPYRIPTFDELNLPSIMEEFTKKPRGLVLVTGPTGSGKSTTIAAMLDKINNEREEHIITIEDPIEFVHLHKRCIVNQREVHSDTKSFGSALKVILRQDPDVVLIGEMRDLETIEAALTISETGHLAFATLHTNNCAQTINRIIDVFPTNQQEQVRAVLSFVIEGIISQTLIPKIGGGRIMALEIMIPTPAIRNLIREDKIEQIYSSMQTGQSKFGMQTMNQSLYDLYSRKLITLNDCMSKSSHPDELQDMINRGKPAKVSK